MTMQVDVTRADVKVGDEITVWWARNPSCGQGGTVRSVAEHGLTLVAGEAQHVHNILWGEVDHITAERFYPAEDCLDFGPDCSGPVDDRWPGEGHKSWPRCQHHGDIREARGLENSRRYPDSDLPPAFDPAYAGERWGDD